MWRSFSSALAVVAATSGEQGGDYQKYIDQYAGDYKKYINQGGDQGGDYKKYIDQYAGDYKKYMHQGGDKQGGDYQKYIDQYAGDYKKYMHQGDDQQGGDYHKYMDKYAGDYKKYMHQGGDQQDGDYQKYIDQYAGDYKKYMNKSGSQQGGDYQKYIDQYAGDYKKYMKQGGGEQLMAKPLMLAAMPQELDEESTTPSPSTSDEEPFWQKYVHKYAGDYVPIPENVSDRKAWRDAFIDRYAGAYKHYIDAGRKLRKDFPDAPANAKDCHTMDCLKEWRDAQRQAVDAYVPKEFAPFADGDVNQTYADNKARIEEEIANATSTKPAADDSSSDPSRRLSASSEAEDEPPFNTSDNKAWRDYYIHKYAAAYEPYIRAGKRAQASKAPKHASECHTMEELQAWREKERDVINSFVPKPFRGFAAGNVEQQYADNKARIEKEQAEASTTDAPAATDVPAAATDAPAAATDAPAATDASEATDAPEARDAEATDAPAFLAVKDSSIHDAAPVKFVAQQPDTSAPVFLVALMFVAVVAGMTIRPWSRSVRDEGAFNEALLRSEAPLAA